MGSNSHTTLYNRIIANVIPFPNMRKIEMMKNSAIRYRQILSSGNTTVRAFRESVEVYLPGNNIASLDTATHALTIFDGGWQSNTTKSRLNALLDEFVPSMRIFQNDWTWYISDSLDGSKQLFTSGMTV